MSDLDKAARSGPDTPATMQIVPEDGGDVTSRCVCFVRVLLVPNPLASSLPARRYCLPTLEKTRHIPQKLLQNLCSSLEAEHTRLPR